MRMIWKVRGGRYICLLLAGLFLAASLGGCGKSDIRSEGEDIGAEGIYKYQRQDAVMGTNTTAVIYSKGENLTVDVMEKLSSVEKEYISWRVEDSDIERLNASAGSKEGVMVSEDTARYLKQVLELSEVSGGAFDPTMGKLTRLWDVESENPRVPADGEVKSLLKESGYEKIHQKERQIMLEKGASIDLGAVGKGIGCDEAKAILEADPQATGAVISVGGSILVWGEKPDGSDWNVAITDPDDDTEYMGALRLEGEHYISTSGDYEKYFIKDDKRYHHILDPSTGYPANSGLVSVSVVSKNGLLSDGLSTACFVLGRERSIPLLDYYGAEAIFIDQDHKVYVTEGIRDNFQIVREGYSYEET